MSDDQLDVRIPSCVPLVTAQARLLTQRYLGYMKLGA
jgi:hypothetical protein